MAYEWFISYRRKTGGESQAQKVAEILSKYVGKDKVFYDRESMHQTNDWRNTIKAALKSAENFVLLVNEASAAKDQSTNIGGYRYEIKTALKLNKKKTLIEYDKKSYDDVIAKYPSLKNVEKVTFNGEYNFAFEERLCKHFGFDYKAESTAAPTVIKNINIPQNLVPRTQMLEEIQKAYENNNKPYDCVVISGIGGSGKTSLAYLYVNEQNFNNVAWVIVNGKIEDVFLKKIPSLLFSMGDYKDFTRIKETEIKLDIIKSELSKIEGNNLLVFDINTDNDEIIEEIEKKVHNYLPTSRYWKTLVLTRAFVKNDKWFATIPMNTMTEDIAIELFKKNYTDGDGDIDFSNEQLADIVNKLNYHPLLIEQTAKVYATEKGLTAAEILRQINENKVNNEQTKKTLCGLATDGKEKQNIYTYLINICNIEKLSLTEQKFLACFVTWPEEPIVFDVIKQLLPDKPNETLNSLIKRGIIIYQDKQYSIHSLIADVLREQIKTKKINYYTEYLENVNKIIDNDNKSVSLHKCIASSFINHEICYDNGLLKRYLKILYTINDVLKLFSTQKIAELLLPKRIAHTEDSP